MVYRSLRQLIVCPIPINRAIYCIGKMCYNGGMKEIKLTQGKVALIDDIDFDSVSKFRWYYNRGYAVRQPQMVNSIRRGKIALHRFILGSKESNSTDHINGNTLDNRRKNLRFVTVMQNSWNNKSKGITFHKRDKKWQARIQVDGNRIQLGYFPNKKMASISYKLATKKYYGEYARS